MDIPKPSSPPISRRCRLHRRSASSPPSPAGFLLHKQDKFQDSTLEDSVKLLSLNANRRLLKPKSGRTLRSMAAEEFPRLGHEKCTRKITKESSFRSEHPRLHLSPKHHAPFGSSPENSSSPPSSQRTNFEFLDTTPNSYPLSKSWDADPFSSNTSPGDFIINDYGVDESSDSSISLPSTTSKDISSLASPSLLPDSMISHQAASARGSGNHSGLPAPTQDRPDSQNQPIDDNAQLLSTASPGSHPVFPFSRPHSLPVGYSVDPPLESNRTSSASLPPPNQTPYSTLPRLVTSKSTMEASQQGTSTSTDMDSSSARHPARAYASASPTISTPDAHPMTSCHSPSHDTTIVNTPFVYPPPAPPTIFSPAENESERPRAPYESFLNHAPPPENSWIAVETTASQYTLIARLPGFNRDGITLATRRRHVLHLVADSWEPSGGHFERRISFGYDADLSQVRAEFDGEHLRVFIPRRTTLMNCWSSNE